jgi:antibiotic biosynthesis monooxygenase (ABM) superfamily enzyme
VLTLVALIIGPVIQGLPLAPRLAITTAVVVPIMTWVVMPRVTRLFHNWLFPHN